MKKIKIRYTPIISSKRQLFVLITSVLTVGLLATQIIPVEFRYHSVLILGVVSYVLAAYALYDDLEKHEWLTLLALPTMFTLGVSYFYFLLPVRWITRLPVAVFYGIGFYALLLTENIYNVSTGRTIQLIRAAQTVGYYLSLLTNFLLLYILFSLRLPYFLNFTAVLLISLFLFVQYFWSIKLLPEIGKSLWSYSLIFSLIMAEMALAVSFWPLKTLNSALFLSAVFYGILGVGGYELQEKLFKQVAIEFVSLPIFIFILLLLTTSWTS